MVDVENSHIRPASTAAAYNPQIAGKRVHRELRFGSFVLGSTLGEGEFGKVKLGWRTNGKHPSQVAVKLIRRDSIRKGSESEIKVHREINSLRDLSHPNIVSLVEVLKSDKYIGIVLEYASGGDLFEYILQHKYLKEDYAKKLFAQLVSGVDYMHTKGYVHRDLKLENLLLDKHKNIIISDFGFVNSYSKTRGDLMKTLCGSPCYAAPELVLTQSPYEGRKVDIWSMGVILYAMLAGYLPFDDDAENEDGADIVRLYNYIYKTPLTFPEYISPVARDLLRRIIVPNPRRRICMDDIRRHSWLAPYASLLSVRQPEWDRLSGDKKVATTDVSLKRNKRYSMYAESTGSSALILGSAKASQRRSYTSNSNTIYSPPTTSSSLANIVALSESSNGSVPSSRARAGSLSTTEETSPTKAGFRRGHSKSASVSETFPTASLALQAMMNERDAKNDQVVTRQMPEFSSPTRGATYSGAIPTIAESPTNAEFPHKKDQPLSEAKVPRLPHTQKKPRPTSYHPGLMTSSLMNGGAISGNVLEYMKIGNPPFLASSPPKNTSSETVESYQGSPSLSHSIRPRTSRRDSVVTPINVNGVLLKDLNSHENKRNSVLSYLEDKMEQLELSELPNRPTFPENDKKDSFQLIPKLDTELPTSRQTPQIDQLPTFATATDSPILGDNESQNPPEQLLNGVTPEQGDNGKTNEKARPARQDRENLDSAIVKEAKRRNRFSLISFYSSFNESSTQIDSKPAHPTNNGRRILDDLSNHPNVNKEKRVESGSSSKSSQSRKSSLSQANGTYVRGKEASAARKVMNFFKRRSVRAN